MSAFSDPYLAESVGYNNGHARGLNQGIDIGIKRGYTDGWNEATDKANRVIDELNAEVARLRRKNNDLYRQNTDLSERINLIEEQAQALQSDKENMTMAFLGVVAIAKPAMKAVAKLPLHERVKIQSEFAHEAWALQSPEYIAKNSFPHLQALIKKYLPIAREVFLRTHQENEAAQKSAESTEKPAP